MVPIMDRVSFLFILSCFLYAQSGLASCYWRNGLEATYNGIKYTACSDGISMCCLLADGDTCTSQGLCVSSAGGLFRNACTDPTWASPSCSKVCPDINSTYAPVQKCADGSFCCQNDTTCCSQLRGVTVPSNFSSPTATYSGSASSVTPTASTTPTAPPKKPATARDFIKGSAWLATPIVAFIGWFCTWIVGAIQARRKGEDHGRIADLRYTGIIKRTCAAAFLADENNGHPRQIIGFVCMDPGFATSLRDFSGCRAGWFDFTSWAVQVGAMFYSIFLAVYVWTQDASVKQYSPYLQFSLLLGVLNINRGTWAIAACGCFYPGTDKQRMKWLMGTTIVALCIDWIFISRALEMAWHINQTIDLNNQSLYTYNMLQKILGIVSWVLPAIEAGIFFIGLVAGYRRVEYIGPWFFPFIPAAIWLALGPLFIIAVSVLLHFTSK